MRDSSLGEYLIKDVEFPKFYEQIGTYLGMEFTQASVFIERAHYSKNDQFVCLIDGSATVKLVPHIYWNEMYLGEQINKWDPQTNSLFAQAILPSESPINLFKIQMKEYPNFKYVNQMYTENLAPGDCIYMPAFYFY